MPSPYFYMKASMFELQKIATKINVEKDKLLENRKYACSLGLPRLKLCNPHKGKVAIVGSAPSLRETIDELKNFNGIIIAINSAYDILLENGIQPTIFLSMDGQAILTKYLQNKNSSTIYYLASNCAPEVFDLLKDNEVVLWHARTNDIDYPEDEDHLIVGSGSLIAAVRVAKRLGYRDIHIFGGDCSYTDNLYASGKKVIPSPSAIVESNGKEFITTPTLLNIANDFAILYRTFTHNAKLTVYGEGLFQEMIRQLEENPDTQVTQAEEYVGVSQ